MFYSNQRVVLPRIYLSCHHLRNKVQLLLILSVILTFLSILRFHSLRNTKYPMFDSLIDRDERKDFLCLFTTVKPLESKMKIYENLLNNCLSLASERGQVRCILYDTTFSAINRNDTVEKSSYKGDTHRPPVVQKLIEKAQIIGWDVVNLPRVSPYEGLPYFKAMYFETTKLFPNCKFSSFFNADIMFGDGLLPTLQAAEKVGFPNDTLLLIGRRTDVDITPLAGQIFLPPIVNRIVKGHALLHGYAQDFFFVYKNRFPWHVVPDLVIGRVAYDCFIVAKAYQTNVSVVDMTRTVVAVHQSTGDEKKERTSRTHGRINKAIIGPFNYYAGLTDYAPYFSEKDRNTTAVNVYHRCGKRCIRKVEVMSPR